MIVHKVICKFPPFMTDMEAGKTYCYVMLESNIVLYWEDGEAWLERKYMAGWAWGNGLMQGEIVPLSDLPTKDGE